MRAGGGVAPIGSHEHEGNRSVTDELAWEPSVDSEHTGVTAREAVITLGGHVPSYWEKRAAETAAT